MIERGIEFLELLAKISIDNAWMGDAACIDADPDLFFPVLGGSTSFAKEICATCPVREECFEAGQDELYGVWGGTSVEERRRLRTRGRPWR